MLFEVIPVATVRSARDDPAETDHWGAAVSTIEIQDRFPDDCLRGLEEFSHVEVVFLFDRAEERRGVRRTPTPRAGRPPAGRSVL